MSLGIVDGHVVEETRSEMENNLEWRRGAEETKFTKPYDVLIKPGKDSVFKKFVDFLSKTFPTTENWNRREDRFLQKLGGFPYRYSRNSRKPEGNKQYLQLLMRPILL